jgi:Caspase domain
MTGVSDRRALLIGIDAYPHLRQLDGCVNDVTLMRSILQERFAFPPENVTLIANEAATRDAILRELDALVARTQPDDVVVIHYAGHGSQVRDREQDEPSGFDNTIMPYESQGWRGPFCDITDDEINLRLQELAKKTQNTTLVFDSCHSGSITRDAIAKSRGEPKDTRPVSELPPSPIPAVGPGGPAGPSGWAPISDAYVLVAGCRDEETSYEYTAPVEGAEAHGALSYFLCEALGRVQSGTTYRDVFDAIAAKVNAANGAQHPQMEGRIDREIFGIRDLEPMRYVRVSQRSGDTVTLVAGAALGVTVGSRWAIHLEATKTPGDETRLGEIEIVSVRAVTSTGRIVSESIPNVIAADARAFEARHDFGDLRLPVCVPAAPGLDSNVDDMRRRVSESTLLRVATGPIGAIQVVAIPARDSAGDVAPSAGVSATPFWAVLGETGQLFPPTKPLDAAKDVRRNLETIARYRQALSVDNGDPNHVLRGRVRFELLGKRDGQWVELRPENNGGQLLLDEGQFVAFRITNDHTEPLFVSILDFQLSGKVALLYPPVGAQDKLVAGQTFEFPADPSRRIRLDDEANAITDVETFKLIATTEPADFSFLTQDGVRGAFRSPLTLLMESAMIGKRAGTMVADAEPEQWTTVSRSFVLRPKPFPVGDAPVSLPDGSVVRGAGVQALARTRSQRSGRGDTNPTTTTGFSEALRAEGVSINRTIEIGDVQYATAQSAPAGFEAQFSDPGPELGQMVLCTNELGGMSWVFSQPPSDDGSAAGRGQARPRARSYFIPQSRGDGTDRAAGRERGIGSALVKHVIKELVFKLSEPVIGKVSEAFALRWEERRRPYRLRTFTPDDYATDVGRLVTETDWKQLGSGRALLFVHGAFSRAHSAFGGVPRSFIEELHRAYEGRVFAFDHFTLSHDPKENVAWLLGQLPSEIALNIDVVSHGRGGLVTRLLTEKQTELAFGSRQLRVRNAVFVGAPNAGTTLADPDHMNAFIDTYTNLLSFVPDNFVTTPLEGIITVAKLLAVGALGGLRGLQSMRPRGDFERWLNSGSRSGESRYFALASDFTPNEPGLRRLATDRLIDRIFKEKNDLVVPTDGVFSANGSGFFPIDDRHVFEGTSAIAHTDFFASEAARSKIMEWLRV